MWEGATGGVLGSLQPMSVAGLWLTWLCLPSHGKSRAELSGATGQAKTSWDMLVGSEVPCAPAVQGHARLMLSETKEK